MMSYYLAIDMGASSGRHILGSIEDGKIKLEEIYRFENGISQSIPKQELVDLMISSYKLSLHKLKNTLHIVCRKSDDFSMDKIS